MFDEQDRQYFYNEFKNNGYEVGSYDDFKKDLNNKEDRDWYYNEAKNMGYDVGTQEDFDKMVLEPVPSTSATNQRASAETKQQVAQPSAHPSSSNEGKDWVPEAVKDFGNDFVDKLKEMPGKMISTVSGLFGGDNQPQETNQPTVNHNQPQNTVQQASPESKEEAPVTTPTGVVNNEGMMDAKFANYLENWKQRPDKQGTYFENMVADLLADGTANNNEEAVKMVKSALGRYANRSAIDVTNQVVSSLPDDTVQDAEQSIETQWYSHGVQDKLKQEADSMGISYDDYVAQFLKPAMVQSLVNKYGPNYRDIAEGIATRLYSHDENVQDRLMNQDINDALSDVISKYVNPSVVDEYNKAQEAGNKAFTEGMEGSQFIPANLRLGTALGAQYEANEAKDPAKVLSGLQKKFGNLYRNPEFLNDMSNAAFKVMQQYGLNGGMSSDPKQFKPMINSVLKNELDQLEIKGMMPKGSAEYIMKTGLGNTIVGKITRKAMQTDYQNWLEDIANQQYQPGFWENVASGALTFAGDAWSYWLPGAAGGKLTKSMVAKAEGKLAGDLMAKGMERKMAERAAKVLIGKSKAAALKSGAAHGAVTFGGQSAISKPIDEIYRTGQFDENGKIYNPSVGKVIANTLGEVAKQSAVGAIMQGGTIANMVGKGRGLATNILADVGGKVADSGIMTGQQILERMAHDPNFKPTGKDAAESFLESMANLTAIGLPGMMGKYARFKDAKEFNKKFDFTDQDIAELKRFGYDDLRDAFEKVGIGEYAVVGENAQRLDEQLTQKYMDLMNDKSVPEVLKSKMMAVVEGKRPSSFSPVIDSEVYRGDDGKFYLETYNKDGGVIDRKEYSSHDAARNDEKKLEYEKTLGLASVLEGEFHNVFTQEHLEGLYNKAAQKYNMGEKLTDEDKAAVYLHQNAGAIKEIMDKQQKGVILTDEEQKQINAYRHYYDNALENSSVMREFVNTFEDSHDVARGTLRKALESKDKKYAPLVESYLKELYNSIELKREMKQTMDDLYNTSHGNEQKRIEQSDIEGEKPVAPVEGAAPIEGSASVEVSAGGQEPPVSEGPAPYQDRTNSVPSPNNAEFAANPANVATENQNESKVSDAYVMGQNAYKNGDKEGLKSIKYNAETAELRLKRAFANDNDRIQGVYNAVNKGTDIETYIEQRTNYLTPFQQEAIRKYAEAMEANKGAMDALEHADDGYAESLKLQLSPYTMENGNIFSLTLTDGQRGYWKSKNDYGAGFGVFPDANGKPVVKQVYLSQVKEEGKEIPLQEYVNELATQKHEATKKNFKEIFDATSLKPNDTVSLSINDKDQPTEAKIVSVNPDGTISFNIAGSKNVTTVPVDTFNKFQKYALRNSINAELDAEDAKRAEVEAAKAEAEKKQRFTNGIVGLSDQKPDYSSKETDTNVAAEYLQELYAGNHDQLVKLVNGSRSDIKEQIDNTRKRIVEVEDWLDTNADLEPEQAQSREDKLKLAKEQLEDLTNRYDNWNKIRSLIMTDEEKRDLKDERTVNIKKVGIDKEALTVTDEREVPVLTDEELKKQYPTMDEASDYIFSQRKEISKTQEELHRQLQDIDARLNQYLSGETDLTDEEIRDFNTTKADLEARMANLSASAKDLIAQNDSLKKLYKLENQKAREEALNDMSPAEQRRVKAEQYLNDRNISGLTKLYADTSVDFTDDHPYTVDEYVASSIGRHALNYEGREVNGTFLNGLQQEFGGTRKDLEKIQVLAAEGKGQTFDKYVNGLYDNLPDNLRNQGVNTQEIRNSLLALLRGAEKYTDLKNYILKEKIAQAEGEMRSMDLAEEEQRAVYDEEHAFDVANSLSSKIGQSLSKNEADGLVGEMEKRAEPARELELTPENWLAEFGENGKVVTPLGDAKMGENQLAKLFMKGREAELGLIKPTLSDPDVIIEEASHATNSKEERPSSYLFVKTFERDGKKIKFYASVSVKKDGMEVIISNHFMSKNAVDKKMQEGKMLYIKGASTSNSSDSHLAEHQNGVPDLLPTQEVDAFNSVGKDTNNSDNLQGKNKKFSEKLQNAIAETETEPTEAQKKAGNYKKGHLSFGGYDFTVETPKGTTRSGKDEQGKPWSVTMHDTYGYILGKIGVDGDHIDMFINDAADLDTFDGNVFVVDQVNPATGEFDEHKVMYGYPDEAAATKAYLSNYSKGWKGLGKVTSVPKSTFDKWLESSDRKTKPFAEYAMIQQEEAKKAKQTNEALPFDAPMSMDDLPFHRDVKEVKPENLTEAQKVAYDAVSTMLKKAGIPVKVVSNEDMEKVAEAQDNLAVEMLLNDPRLRFYIKTPEQKEAAKAAYDWAAKNRPDKFKQYAIVNMDNPNQPPQYFEKKDLAEKWRKYYTNAWKIGNYKAFNLNKPFEEQIKDVKGDVPSEFDPYKAESLLNKRIELEKQIKETEDSYNAKKKERAEYQNQLMQDYMNQHGLSSENDIPDDVWTDYRDKSFEKYQDTLDDLFHKYVELDNQLKAVAEPGVQYLKGKGVVYGYTDGKEIVLNQEHLNPNTPIHEYQHLWRTAAKNMNPELIEHGDKLIMQTRLFADLKQDPNYNHLTDEQICDEAFARLTGEDGAAILEQMAKDAIKENPLDTAKELSVINKLKEWLKKFWYWALDTFTKWKPEDIKKMTLEDIHNLVLRDLANGVDPRTKVSKSDINKENVELEEVNKTFNQRLDELVENPNQKDKILRLGRSSSFLKAGGIADAEIELDFDKLMRKSKQGYVHEHPFDPTDVKDLPMAIANPISVFNNTNGRNDGQVILTELKKEDRNFIVAIQTENQNRKGGVVLKVNKIVTLFPKDARGVINWFNQGKATNIDKEKALHFIEALQNHSGTTITDEELKSAANIINSFETTKEKGKKFSLEDPKTLAGVHNISEEKLLKAIKQGGLANPSVAVIDTSKQNHESYGDISLILPSDKVAKRTGKNAGTWQGDAWTPTYPQVERQMSNNGSVQASKDVLSVPKEIQHEVRNGIDRWLDGGDANSGLKYLFLHENGKAPKMVESQHKYSDKVYNDLKFITAGDFNISSIGKADTEKVLSMYIDNVFDGDKAAYEEKQKYRIARYKKQVAEGVKNPFLLARAKNALEQYDKYGFYFDKVQDFVRNVERDHRMTGVDTNATLNEVEDYIKSNNLTDEFNTWMEGKEKKYGIKEVIFDGFTPSGNRRYVPNTLESVSKIMKKQGRNGATGTSVSFQNFAAKLMPSYGTLKDIRSKKGLLTSDREKFDNFREKWANVFYELGMKCQPDATGSFDDYGLARLSEAAMTSDPQAYLKKEYNVDFSDEDTKRLKEMVKAIKEEHPAMYFETKFERPVGFNEFSSAVVPSTASNEVKQALQNAGVQIYEYDKQNEGDRSRAFNEAINSNHEIRFHRVTEVKSPIVEQKLQKHPDSLMKAGTYFSGGGLVEEGLKGIIDPVVAVEYDRKISGVYRNNFGQHIVTADVRDVDPKELVKHIDGEVEYFHASPVCKNYSQAKSNSGEVELDKETAKSTADFIDAVKPRVVTIENVKGYKDSEAMKIITKALDKNGYTWDSDVYNAADFGGYTSRERLIVRAVKDSELPEKPKKQPRKGGWLEAVEDILPTLTVKESGVAPWMDARLKADGIDWQKVEKPLYVMGSAYADGKIPHAYGDEILPTLRTKSGDVIIMPGGKVLRADGRVLARITGLGDDYLLPKTESLAHTIIGNGIPVQLTKGVIAPLLNKDDLSGRNVLARLGSSIFKNNWDADKQKKVSDQIVNTANKLGGAEATVYTSVDEVPDAYLSDVKNGATGWYDPTTHTVHVYLPNCADANEAERTVLHEKIGHEGMEVLLGGEDGVRKFANFVYNSVAASTRSKILDITNKYDPDWKNPDRMNVGTQEYIARLAEEGPKSAEDFTLWTKIKHYLIRLLKKLGIRVPGLLNDKDLRYYLMKAGKALHVWDEMPQEKQKAMMKQASNAEIKDSLGEKVELSSEEDNKPKKKTERGRIDEATGAFKLAPNGEQSNLSKKQYIEARTKNFKDWFGGDWEKKPKDFKNKLDANGEPLEKYVEGYLNRPKKPTMPKKRKGEDEATFFGRKMLYSQALEDWPKTEADWKKRIDEFDENTLAALTPPDEEAIREKYQKQYENDMASWRKDHPNIEEGEERPLKIPDMRDYQSIQDYGEALGKHEIWKTAPNKDEYERMAEDEIISKVALMDAVQHPFSEYARLKAMKAEFQHMRHVMQNQKVYDQNTTDAVVQFAKRFMSLGYGDDLGRGSINTLLTIVKNSTGKKSYEISQHLYQVMDVLMNNQLRNFDRAVMKTMSIKELKENAKGIQVQGKLELRGQTTIKAFRDAVSSRISSDKLDEKISNLIDKMAADKKNASSYQDELLGLNLAKQYVDYIDSSRNDAIEIEDMKRMEIEGYKNRKGIYEGELTQALRQEHIERLNQYDDALFNNKVERMERYSQLLANLGGMIDESVKGAREFQERDARRAIKVKMMASADLGDKSMNQHHKENWKSRLSNSDVARLFCSPLGSFDALMREFGSKQINGEGQLWNHFVRGAMKASNDVFKSVREANNEIDLKVSELFGKVTEDKNGNKKGNMILNDLYALERSNKVKSLDVTIRDIEGEQTYKLQQGNLMYIYMVNKMPDGAMKLRQMGILDADVERIKENIDPRFLKLADWIQGEFLPKMRTKYNKRHEELFGAPMPMVENYFPLRVLKNARYVEEDVNNTSDGSNALPSTATGAILKRKINKLPLDILNADALSVTIDNIKEMENWYNYAPIRKDANTLLSDTAFRNRVQNMTTIYGSGERLWNNVKDATAVAMGTYRPKGGTDLAVSIKNIGKGITGAKISGRLYTAFKQILSFPLFLADADLGRFAWYSANPYGSFKWAIENMPNFDKRWSGRKLGDTVLMDDPTDWKIWHTNLMEKAAYYGMTPNALVDAVTCAVGARAVYDTKYKQYIKAGLTEERAKEKALSDAEINFNTSQQSSEGVFVSPMQLDRTLESAIFTPFRNSSMLYERKGINALRNLKHRFEKGHKEASIKYMAAQLMEEGVGYEQATKAAKKMYQKGLMHNIADAIVSLWLGPIIWNLGGSLGYLIPYLGDDSEKKKKMLTDAVILGLLEGPVDGLAGGQFINTAISNTITSDGISLKGLKNVDFSGMPMLSDFSSMIEKFGYDKVAGVQDLMFMVMQSSTGFNPKTLTDAINACIDYGNGDMTNAKEIALFVFRLMNGPAATVDNLYIDELGMKGKDAKKLSYEELAKRYAEYKFGKNTFGFGKLYSDEEKQKKLKAIEKSFDEKVSERLAGMDREDLKNEFSESRSQKEKKLIGKIIADELETKDSEAVKKAKADASYLRQRNFSDLMDDLYLQKEWEATNEANAGLEELKGNGASEKEIEAYKTKHKADLDKRKAIQKARKKMQKKKADISSDNDEATMAEIRKLRDSISKTVRQTK